MPTLPSCGRVGMAGFFLEDQLEALAAMIALTGEVILDGASKAFSEELNVAVYRGHAHFEFPGKLRRVGVGPGADGIQYAQVPLEHEACGFLAVRAAFCDVARLFGG